MSWKTLGLATILLCITAGIGQAQYERWDLGRSAGVLWGGVAIYNDDYDGYETVTTGFIRPTISYSLSQKISGVAYYYTDLAPNDIRRERLYAGATFALHGTDQYDRFHFGAAAGYARLGGEGYTTLIPLGLIQGQDALVVSLPVAWSMLKTQSGRTVVGLQFQPTFITTGDNGIWEFPMALGWQIWGGD